MRTFPLRVAAISVASSLTFCASAQDSIETLIISGARTPIQFAQLSGNATIIDAEQIRQSQASDLSDLLRGYHGIAVSQSGGKGSLNQLRLRGSEANHVLVLIDGVEISDLGQGVDFAHLNLQDVERIEILRGAQSALWGSGAVGGVINIITHSAAEHTQGHLQGEWGEASSQRYSGQVSGASDALGYSLSASHFETDGHNISRAGDEKDGFEQQQVAAKLNWQLNPAHRLQVQYRSTQGDSQYDEDAQFIGIPVDVDRLTENHQQSGQLLWRYQQAESGWQQQAGWQWSENDNQTFAGGIFSSSTLSKKQRWYWQSHYNYKANSHLNLVAEHSQEDFEQAAIDAYGDPNQRQQNKVNSALVDLLHELNNQWNYTASVRHDDNDIFDNATSYQLGMNYHPTSQVKLYISHGKAIKNPTFIETFGYYPASFAGNPNLAPEESRNWEIGGHWQFNDNWQLGISLFDASLENEIRTVYLPDFTSTSVNLAEESERQGADISVQGNVGNFSIQASYGYLDSTEADDNSEQQPELRRPEHTAQVVFNYAFANKANINLQASYQGEQLDMNFGTYPAEQVTLDAYTLVNLALSYQLTEQWQLSVRAENLFDKGYEDVYGYVGQERRSYAGVRYQF